MTAVILCSLPVTLAVADESGAATATGTLGSVVTTATHEVSSTAQSSVPLPSKAPVTPASSPAATVTAPIGKIATPPAAAVGSAAATTTGTARDAGPIPAHALNDPAAAVTRTVSHAAKSTSGVTHDAGSAVSTATTAVTHTVNRVASASNVAHTVTQVTQASSRVLTHTVTQAVPRTAASPVLSGTTNAVAGVARSTHVGGVATGLIATATSIVKGTGSATATTTLTRGRSNGPGSSAGERQSAHMRQVPAAPVTPPSSSSGFDAGLPSFQATPASSAQAVFNGASGSVIASQPSSGAPLPGASSALLGQSVWGTTSSTLPVSSTAWTSHTGAPGTGASIRPAPAPSEHAPSPGGASPATAASTGFGLSIFPILAGLLMLAVPWAKRRLRLASEPWRLAPFVLIPERPG